MPSILWEGVFGQADGCSSPPVMENRGSDTLWCVCVCECVCVRVCVRVCKCVCACVVGAYTHL